MHILEDWFKINTLSFHIRKLDKEMLNVYHGIVNPLLYNSTISSIPLSSRSSPMKFFCFFGCKGWLASTSFWVYSYSLPSSRKPSSRPAKLYCDLIQPTGLMAKSGVKLEPGMYSFYGLQTNSSVILSGKSEMPSLTGYSGPFLSISISLEHYEASGD